MKGELRTEEPIEHPMEALRELEEKLAEAETELAGYRSVQDIATVELNEMRAKLAALEKEGAGKGLSGAELTELNALRVEVEGLRAKQAELQELESLKVKANQSDYFAKQLETARETIATLEEKMLQQPAQNLAAFADLQKLAASLDSELTLLKAKLEDRDAEIAALKSSLKESRDLTKELEAAKAELLAHKQKGDVEHTLRDTIQELSTQLEAAKVAVVDLRANSKNQQSLILQANAELDDLRAENDRLKDELDDLKNAPKVSGDCEAKVQMLEERLAENAADIAAYEDLKEAKEQLQHRAALLEAELLEKRAAADELAEAQAKLAEAQSAEFELAQLRARMRTHGSALKDVVEQFDDAMGEAESAAPFLKVA